MGRNGSAALHKSGTGMGLPIVRRMLQAHGGDIVLAPDGPGSRFVITF